MHGIHSSALSGKPEALTAPPLAARQEQLESLAQDIENREAMAPILEAMVADTGLTTKNLWQRDFLTAAKLLRRFQARQPFRIQDGFDASLRRPLGTVACILPGNGALNILCKVLAPSFLAGNHTRFRLPTRFANAAEKIRVLVQRHFPEVEVDHSSIRGENASYLKRCLKDPLVKAIVIFGSDAWVSRFKDLAAETGTKLIFEGPGNDPTVVFPDASPNHAAKAILKNALTNGGQSCSAIKRIYVHRNILKPFTEALIKCIPKFKCGLPHGDDIDIGPTQSPNLRKRIEAQMRDAREGGASFIYGDGGLDEHHVFRPTVILAKPGMDVVIHETFYSVLPLIPFSSEAEALSHVTSTSYGLNASYFGTSTHAFQRSLYQSHKTLSINSTITDPANMGQAMLTGGFKNSGFISEWGLESGSPNPNSAPHPEVSFWQRDPTLFSRKYITRQGRFFLRQELSRELS